MNHIDYQGRGREIGLEAVPCPFCYRRGEMLILVTRPGRYPGKTDNFVECRACSARGPVAGWVARAVSLWNQSARKDQQ